MKLGKPTAASSDFAENVNDKGCLWPINGTDHSCGAEIEKVFRDSGMGYCLKHSKRVVQLREWAAGVKSEDIAA